MDMNKAGKYYGSLRLKAGRLNYELLFLASLCWFFLYLVYFRISPAYSDPFFSGKFHLYSKLYFFTGGAGINLVLVLALYAWRFFGKSAHPKRICVKAVWPCISTLALVSAMLFYNSFYGGNWLRMPESIYLAVFFPAFAFGAYLALVVGKVHYSDKAYFLSLRIAKAKKIIAQDDICKCRNKSAP